MAQNGRIDLRLPEQEPDSRSKYDLSNMTTAEWLLFFRLRADWCRIGSK